MRCMSYLDKESDYRIGIYSAYQSCCRDTCLGLSLLSHVRPTLLRCNYNFGVGPGRSYHIRREIVTSRDTKVGV
jgi:hypothetical protein